MQYKLIKEYPGSPILNTIIDNGNSLKEWRYTTQNLSNIKSETSIDILYFDPINYKEFWQKIKNKEYEILAFRGKSLIFSIFTLKKDGLYYHNVDHPNETHPLTLTTSLNNFNLEIYSVNRLSDGEIFTIGDRVTYNNRVYWDIFGLSINSDGDYMMANEKGTSLKDCNWCSIHHKDFRKVITKQKLFTTEDGVDIFDSNTIVYGILNSKSGNTLGAIQDKKVESAINFINTLWYSTREKVEEYILMNIPCLSLKDIIEHFELIELDPNEIYKYRNRIAQNLHELVKSKLNIK